MINTPPSVDKILSSLTVKHHPTQMTMGQPLTLFLTVVVVVVVDTRHGPIQERRVPEILSDRHK
jgi:hypothetical protein